MALKVVEDRTTGQFCYTVDSEIEKGYLPTTTTQATGPFADYVELQTLPALGSTCNYLDSNGDYQCAMLFSSGWVTL